MRDMKARSMIGAEARKEGREAQKVRSAREQERMPDVDVELDEGLEIAADESLSASEDGSFSVRRGRGRQDDEDGGDLPSEPPPGWLDG